MHNQNHISSIFYFSIWLLCASIKKLPFWLEYKQTSLPLHNKNNTYSQALISHVIFCLISVLRQTFKSKEKCTIIPRVPLNVLNIYKKKNNMVGFDRPWRLQFILMAAPSYMAHINNSAFPFPSVRQHGIIIIYIWYRRIVYVPIYIISHHICILYHKRHVLTAAMVRYWKPI